MALGLELGLHAMPWSHHRPGAHVARAGLYYLHAQVEAGHGCSMTMTFASVPTLKLTPAIAEEWLPKVLACAYDPRNVPYAVKKAVTIGMGEEEWTIAVQEEAEEQKHRDWMATEPDRIAAR